MELRGFITPEDNNNNAFKLPDYDVPATPLTGVDMIEAEVAGVIAWKVKTGDYVVVDILLLLF